MKENSYDQLDDLFAQIRLRLALVRQSDPATAAELKELFLDESLFIGHLGPGRNHGMRCDQGHLVPGAGETLSQGSAHEVVIIVIYNDWA